MSRQKLWSMLALAGVLSAGAVIWSEASGQDTKPQPPKAPTGGAGQPPGNTPPKTPPSPPPPGVPGAPPKAAPGQVATVNVQCPANATIWIEGQKMTSTGGVRSFQSPPLEAGKAFYYSFKLSWPSATGQPDTVVEREVIVRAGQTTVLDFRPQGTVETPIMTQPPLRYTRPGFGRPEGSRRR